MDKERLSLKIGIECDRDFFTQTHETAWQHIYANSTALTQEERVTKAEEILYQTELVFDQLSTGNFNGEGGLLSSVFDPEMGALITTLSLNGKSDQYGNDDYITETAYFHVVRYIDKESDQDLAYELFVGETARFYQQSHIFPLPQDINIARQGKLAGIYVANRDMSEVTPLGLTELVEANETIGSLCKMSGIVLPDNYFVSVEE